MLNGNTGPLVYPAGFVYIYTGLYHLTEQGTNIKAAQWIFAALYLATFAVIGSIYALARPAKDEEEDKWWKPFLVLGCLCVSKRIHSIFVLRMFNDAIAMLLVYVAIYLFCKHRWVLGCTVFSVAFSVKMNIVLFAPGLLALLLAHHTVAGTLALIVWCGAVQVLLGLPFLLTDPIAYVSRSFNVGRVFTQKWSVNFKWVPCTPYAPGHTELLRDCEGIFTSKAFGLACFGSMLLLMAVFYWWRWSGLQGGRACQLSDSGVQYTPNQIVSVLFTSNLIGVICARSLHFQFYVWYFHSLPFLLFQCTRLPAWACLGLLVAIELAWNPWKGDTSSVESSVLLTLCHAVLLPAVWDGMKHRMDGPPKLKAP